MDIVNIVKNFLIIVIIIFSCLVGIALLSSATETVKEENKTEVEKVTAIETIKTPIKKLEEVTISILGDKTNMGEKRIIKILIENNEAIIGFHADENFTTNMTRGGILTDIKYLLQEVPNTLDPQINSIFIETHFTLIDKYGNESIRPVVMLTMKKEVWEKINWDNFNRDNFSNVADTYWIHPAFK